ncbi:MAG: tetratricopeptide repeat protein [Pyrinomonadaceae bacterium]|nr:tetratricopeptide repeat protein [Pyrinomonadaceae bacterium]
MKILGCLIILSFTLLFNVFGQTPKTEKEWFTLGFKQREEYKFGESVISFTECLKINPNSSPCLGLRAKSYWNLSQLDLAEKDFNRSIEISPNAAALYLNRGEFRQSSLDNQKNELALADFTKAIQLKPDFADAYYFRGKSSVFKKDYNAAETDYKKALEINPNHTSAKKALEKLKTERPSASSTPSPTYRPSNPTPVYQPKAVPSPTPTLSEAEKTKRAENFFNSAVYNFRGEKFEAAAQDFTEYLKLYPNNANVYFNRGTAYQRAGKNDLAKADFEKALQLQPDFPAVKTQLEKLKATPKEESVTSISQIKDVKPTDEFYDDLRSLIERYGISVLTVNYQYNPNLNLTLLEYSKFIQQSKEVLKNAASGFGVKKMDEEKLFNSKCSFSSSFVNSIPETEIAKSLGCIFRIENLALKPTEKIMTRGKFAIFLNYALEQAALKITISQQSENVTNKLFAGDTKQTPKPDLAKPNTQTDWIKFLNAGTEKLNTKD